MLKDTEKSERRKTVVCGAVLEFTFSFIQQKIKIKKIQKSFIESFALEVCKEENDEEKI